MSLNTIELPDIAIEALYGDHLLIAAATPAATSPRREPAYVAPISSASGTSPSAPGYKFLGNNQKKITILVDSPGMPFLPDDQLAFLTKMLEACKMNIGDVAIVNQATTPVDIAALKKQLSPTWLLLFGPGPGEIGLPIHFPTFKIQPYDQCSFLWVPSLGEMLQAGEESKLLKTKLWVCLRALFEI
jgi:hypothetical protein